MPNENVPNQSTDDRVRRPCPYCGSTSGLHPVDAQGCAEYEARGSQETALVVSTEMIMAGLNVLRRRHPIPYRYLPDLHEDLIAAYQAMRGAARAK
jgi:hypothetical protein